MKQIRIPAAQLSVAGGVLILWGMVYLDPLISGSLPLSVRIGMMAVIIGAFLFGYATALINQMDAYVQKVNKWRRRRN